MQFDAVVYEHAAAFIGRTPWDVSRDAALLVEAHVRAFDRYAHAPVVPGIDVYNVEAEAYGASVAKPAGNEVPAISDALLDDVAALADLPPLDLRAGRIPLVFEAAQSLRHRRPNAAVRIPVSGPFSIACSLLGMENALCAALTEPEAMRRGLARICSGQLALCRAAAEVGLAVTVFESAATPPLLAPDTFATLVAPALAEILTAAREANNAPAALIVGGDTLPILPAMAATKPGALICPAETDQAAFMEAVAAWPDIRIRINMHAHVFTDPDPTPALHAAAALAAIAGARPGVTLGSGVLPYDAVPATVLAVKLHKEYDHADTSLHRPGAGHKHNRMDHDTPCRTH